MTDPNDSLQRARSRFDPPEPAFDRLLAHRRRKRRTSRIASLAMAFVVVAAGLAGAAIAFTGRATHHLPAADGDGTAPNLVAGPGQYYYWKTVRPIAGGDVVEELWWGGDGSGRYKADSTNPNYGVPPDQTWGPGDFPRIFPFETDLSKLSTDPGVLAGQLRERSGEGGASPEPTVTIGPGLSPENSSLWRSLTNLVEMGNATPSLRSAIFAVTTDMSGVDERTGLVDPVGRPSIALSVPLGDYYCRGNDVMYFDPDTHLLLASDGDLGCAPSVIVVAGGIVDSTAQIVRPGDGYIPPPVSRVP